MDSVYLHELEEDHEERLVLTGLFDGELHRRGDVVERAARLPFDEALAWARERAAIVYVDAEDGRFSAGAERARHVPELPAETAVRIRTGRRRAAADWWLDRTEADDPIRFEIVVALVPGELDSEHRAERERVIERVAQRLSTDGFERVRYSTERFEAGLRSIEREWEAAGRPAQFGWVGSMLEIQLTAETEAPEHRAVAERVTRLASDEIARTTGREPHEEGAEDIDGRWALEVDVHPPGYERPPLPV